MRRRIPTAWAVSALVHAVVAGALFGVRRTPHVAEPAIEIEVGEPPRPDELPPVPVARPDDAHLPPAPRVRAPARRPDAPPTAPAPSWRASARDDDRSSEVIVPDSPSGRPPDLSLRGLPAGVQDKLAGPAPPPDVTLRAWPHRPSVDELRVELERTEDAVANVRSGRVDPLLYDYLRGAKARLESEASRLADEIPVGPGDAARGWGRGYLERVRQVSRNGATSEDQADLRDLTDRRRPDVLSAYDEGRRLAEAGAELREVEICVDIAPGRESKATLRRGSGNPALDRVAVDSFEKAAAARPVPPDTRGGRACYEVTISAHRVPPLPVVGCAFDLTDITKSKCYWPYKKLSAVSSRLVSVDYPPDPRAARNRSLLRAPR